MGTKWFVQSNERVEGPMSSDEIQARLRAGQLAGHHLVWGVGMEHWRTLDWWSQDGGTSITMQTQTQAAPQDIWHYAQNGQSHGPFTKENLIADLKSNGALSDVLLWTKGMKEWAPLFEFHDILSRLGVNKRVFPRADISGQVIIKSTSGSVVAPLLTISEGGIGAQLEDGLSSGTAVAIELQCPAFPGPLHAKADVRYVVDGIVGLRFTTLSPETKSAIVSYVRQSQSRFVLKAG